MYFFSATTRIWFNQFCSTILYTILVKQFKYSNIRVFFTIVCPIPDSMLYRSTTQTCRSRSVIARIVSKFICLVEFTFLFMFICHAISQHLNMWLGIVWYLSNRYQIHSVNVPLAPTCIYEENATPTWISSSKVLYLLVKAENKILTDTWYDHSDVRNIHNLITLMKNASCVFSASW